MHRRLLSLATVAFTLGAHAQHVTNPHASFFDVPSRMAYVAAGASPLVKSVIANLPSCLATPLIPAPAGVIDIPHHYLTGSGGPTNPAEAAATRVYNAFERRITAGMNQYVATGSHAESACALAQLDAWANAKALLDYDPKESSQAWFQVEWTLSSAGITESVLVDDDTLDTAQKKRVIAWLDSAARELISYERPNGSQNNHHDWRALAATSIGVIASDDKLFRFGIDTYKEAIGQLDRNGALPLEMERGDRATHYQGFALQPLILIAEFAQRQGIDLYAYSSHGRTLRDAILFFGRAIDDTSILHTYTSEPQRAEFDSADYAPFVFYLARFGPEGLPRSLLQGLSRPTEATRIGGNTTLLAAK